MSSERTSDSSPSSRASPDYRKHLVRAQAAAHATRWAVTGVLLFAGLPIFFVGMGMLLYTYRGHMQTDNENDHGAEAAYGALLTISLHLCLLAVMPTDSTLVRFLAAAGVAMLAFVCPALTGAATSLLFSLECDAECASLMGYFTWGALCSAAALVYSVPTMHRRGGRFTMPVRDVLARAWLVTRACDAAAGLSLIVYAASRARADVAFARSKFLAWDLVLAAVCLVLAASLQAPA